MNEALRLGYGVEGGSPRLVPAEGAVIGGYHLPGGVSDLTKQLLTAL